MDARDLDLQVVNMPVSKLLEYSFTPSNSWLSSDKARLIESIIVGIPIGMVTVTVSNKRVVDGSKRIEAIVGYINGEFALRGDLVYLNGLADKFFDELPAYIQRKILETQVIVLTVRPGVPQATIDDLLLRIKYCEK